MLLDIATIKEIKKQLLNFIMTDLCLRTISGLERLKHIKSKSISNAWNECKLANAKISVIISQTGSTFKNESNGRKKGNMCWWRIIYQNFRNLIQIR